MTASFLFSVLVDHLQQFLGFERPVFIYDWPAFQTSALEKEGAEITERSEGIHLRPRNLQRLSFAHAITRDQKESSRKQLERRKIEDKEPVELDEAYMEAVRQGLPQDSAMALGFDRLVMLLADQADIRSDARTGLG